ncbi:hypothetical protein IE53DRAFT_275372 [Violaceomyces palustris]|uniref:Uncharacterized protein n=1 Tax=Violaceomyces palustris TaxID=1673888 RepID=A0ACD0P893_9BASI|nr:hypothetical protein IE53DRAFT_275372 [Violaceomyces palustris]
MVRGETAGMDSIAFGCSYVLCRFALFWPQPFFLVFGFWFPVLVFDFLQKKGPLGSRLSILQRHALRLQVTPRPHPRH